jgi:prepilin-type N-terminal cleavage/methylation domain-containing protein
MNLLMVPRLLARWRAPKSAAYRVAFRRPDSMAPQGSSKTTPAGFTLVELLVVIAIVGLLIAMLLPAIQSARMAARRATCQSNMRQVGIALHMHHDAQGRLPAGWQTADGDPEGEPGWGWASKILPFVEQSVVYKQIDFRKPILADMHDRVRVTTVPVFRCPSDTGELVFVLGEADHDHHHDEDEEEEGHEDEGHDHGVDDESHPALAEMAGANYVGVFGDEEIEHEPDAGTGVFFHNSAVRFREIRDGTSQTVIVGERSSRLGHSLWAGAVPGSSAAMARVVGTADHTPNHPSSHFDDFGSYHPGGTHFVFGDGAVRFISEEIDLEVYQALTTRAGGDSVSRFFAEQ